MLRQLINYVNPFVKFLENLQDGLINITKSHRDANRDLCYQKMSLVFFSNSQSQGFSGYAADSFVNSVDQNINDSENLARILDTVINAGKTSAGNIEGATFLAEFGISNEDMLQTVLERLDLKAVLEDGAHAVQSVFKDIINSHPHRHMRDNYQDRPIEPGGQMYIVLTQWADAIHNASEAFLREVQVCNMSSVGSEFTEIAATQYSATPITIRKIGSNDILVTIAGTDNMLTHQCWDNNVRRAISAGDGEDPNPPYLQDVQHAIQQYLNEHPEFHNPNVTIEGYSLGGIIAQKIAGKDNKKFIVSHVITVGSPEVSSPHKDVRYDLYVAGYDPIPLLSPYESQPLQDKHAWMNWIQPGAGTGAAVADIYKIYHSDWDTKRRYIDRGHFGKQLHLVPDVGNHSSKLWNWLDNHEQYGASNWLWTQHVLPEETQMGPVEYFPMQH